MTSFEPARITTRETAADACARVLRNAILSRELEPGQKLPPERKLAESLGVNRLTLRNALAQLASAGLVSVRQGSGYTVNDYQRAGGLDLLPGLMQLSKQRGDLRALARELLFLRRHLASAVLERVAMENDTDALAAVADAIATFVAVVDETDDSQRVAEADMDVLAALLTATGSPVLALCLNPVVSVIAGFDELREAMYAEPKTNAAAYQLLLNWLADPQPGLSGALSAELARRDETTLSRIPQRNS